MSFNTMGASDFQQWVSRVTENFGHHAAFGSKNATVVIGDSITHGWIAASGAFNWWTNNTREFQAGRALINYAWPGDNISHAHLRVHFLHALLPTYKNVEVKRVVLLIGTNDLGGDFDTIGTRMAGLIVTIRQVFPGAKIGLWGLLPREDMDGFDWISLHNDYAARALQVNQQFEFIATHNADVTYFPPAPLVGIPGATGAVDDFEQELHVRRALPAGLGAGFLHPNAQGYEKMGAQLQQIIDALL